MLVSTTRRRGGERRDKGNDRPQWSLRSFSNGVGLEISSKSQHLQLIADGPKQCKQHRENIGRREPKSLKSAVNAARIAIDTSAQTFEARFVIVATWSDPTIDLKQFYQLSRIEQEDFLAQCWRPRRVKFINEIESNYTCTFEIDNLVGNPVTQSQSTWCPVSADKRPQAHSSNRYQHDKHSRHRKQHIYKRSGSSNDHVAFENETTEKSMKQNNSVHYRAHPNCSGTTAGPTVRLTILGQAKFLTHMSLEMFPFDAQDLTMSFTMLSRDHEIHYVSATPNDEEKTSTGFIHKCNGALHKSNFVQSEWQPCVPSGVVEISKQDAVPIYHICLHVQRLPGHYITNVFVPFLVITALTWTAYLIPWQNIGSRLQVILTLVLTSVTFKLVVASQLPTISYNTFCDIYVLSGISFQTLIALHVGVSYNLRKSSNEEISDGNRMESAAIVAALWAALHLYMYVRVSQHRHRVHDVKVAKKRFTFVRTTSFAKLKSSFRSLKSIKSIRSFRRSVLPSRPSWFARSNVSISPDVAGEFKRLETIPDQGPKHHSNHEKLVDNAYGSLNGTTSLQVGSAQRTGARATLPELLHQSRREASTFRSLLHPTWRHGAPTSLQSQHEQRYSQQSLSSRRATVQNA